MKTIIIATILIQIIACEKNSLAAKHVREKRFDLLATITKFFKSNNGQALVESEIELECFNEDVKKICVLEGGTEINDDDPFEDRALFFGCPRCHYKIGKWCRKISCRSNPPPYNCGCNNKRH
jgi:hypothetical protein